MLGISADGVRSHRKFKKKNGLPFPLLADTEKKMIEAYGVWGEKTAFGVTYMGIRRTTYVIAPDGTIAKVYEQVKPDGHSAEVLEFLRSMPLLDKG